MSLASVSIIGQGWHFAEACLVFAVIILAALGLSWWRQILSDKRTWPQPKPDLAVLTDCPWCADTSEDPEACTCRSACTEVEWCIARYDRTNTAVGVFTASQWAEFQAACEQAGRDDD